MAETPPKLRFKWTDQCQRRAVLLSALGHSDMAIALCLDCARSVVSKRLGPQKRRPALSPSEFQLLFAEYDAQRNMEEIIIAASGSMQQARLRTSLRGRISQDKIRPSEVTNAVSEEFSDEQIRRDVEALVARTRDLRDQS